VKILVLSDSHASLSFMRLCIRNVKPDAVVHLGDYFDDGTAMEEEFGLLRFYQVPGNCDKYRIYTPVPETLVEKVCGVKLFMTHGHIHRVKVGLGALLADGRRTGAQAVLFGHTHCAYCTQEDDGLWVLNPGSCGYYGGSAGLIEVEREKIIGCRILRQPDLEASEQ
jgi:putative phosphoesterase